MKNKGGTSFSFCVVIFCPPWTNTAKNEWLSYASGFEDGFGFLVSGARGFEAKWYRDDGGESRVVLSYLFVYLSVLLFYFLVRKCITIYNHVHASGWWSHFSFLVPTGM